MAAAGAAFALVVFVLAREPGSGTQVATGAAAAAAGAPSATAPAAGAPSATAPPTAWAAGSAAARGSAAPSDPAARAYPESAQPPLPASLRGTEVDGALVLDADGVFRGDAGAIALFDYFLATLGETDLDGVRALVAAEAARRLPGHEAEVLALFDRYVAYLERLDDATRDPLPPGAVDPRRAARAFLERRQATEVDDFGAAAAARLFGDADRLAAALVDGDDSALPAGTRAARAAATAPADVAAEVTARRAAGASDAEVWQLRADRFGPEAADRLAALDARRRR